MIFFIRNYKNQPMFITSFLFIAPIKPSFTQKIIKSSPTRCILELRSTFQGPQKLQIKYPIYLIPDFPHIKSKNNILIATFNDKFIIHLSFSKLLFKTYEYYGNIENGYIFPPSMLKIGDKLIFSESVLDQIVIPDFTVPFIAFNTCSTVVVFVFSVIFWLIDKK